MRRVCGAPPGSPDTSQAVWKYPVNSFRLNEAFEALPWRRRAASPDDGGGANEFVRLFVKHKAAVYRNLDALGMCFAQLCFPVLYARCREGFWAEERPEFLLVTNGRRHYVLPLVDDRRAFEAAVVRLVRKGGRVMSFPKVASLRGRANRYPEYVCETELLATMPGRRLKTYRRDAKRLEAAGLRVEEGAGPAGELLGLNSAWYAEYEGRKGFRADRLAESEAIISLCCAGLEDSDLVRVFRAVLPVKGVEYGGGSPNGGTKLCGFVVTCRLSETFWACVLSRSLSEHSGLGHYLWHRAAQVYQGEGVPLENDNTGGGDPALSAYKARFSSASINTHQVWRGWLAGYL